MFIIRMGIPEMKQLWDDLCKKNSDNSASKDEQQLYKKLGKTLLLLANNPRHPGLCSHDIDELTKRYGIKVWESYLENKTPGVGRIFWVYGPDRQDITIIGIEPHPNDKKDGYTKITLSVMDKKKV